MGRIPLKACIALGGIAFATSVYSAAVNAQGDVEAGQAKSALCGGCHGFDGNSDDASFPRLAGQYADYITKQLTDFKLGHRANDEIMGGMAELAGTEQDAKDIGAYYSQQKMRGMLTKPRNEVVAQGEKIFREGNAQTGVYGCINCHGERGKGKSASVSTFPVIGGQHRDYLVKQLKEFRAGVRENDPAGMMGEVTMNLTDEEINAVAEYLSRQL